MKNKNFGNGPIIGIIALGIIVVVLYFVNSFTDEMQRVKELRLRTVETNASKTEYLFMKQREVFLKNILDPKSSENGEYEKKSLETKNYVESLKTQTTNKKSIETVDVMLGINQKITDFEKESIRLAREGKIGEALSLLKDDNYISSKDKFLDIISNAKNVRISQANKESGFFVNFAKNISLYRLIIAISLIGLSLFLVIRVKKYTKEQQELIKKVEDANADLEKKVEERTRDAEEKNEELQQQMEVLNKMSRDLEDEAEERKTLQEEAEKNKLQAEARAHFEESLSHLSYTLTGDLSIEDASNKAIDVVTKAISAQMSAIYISDQNQIMVKKASFLYPDNVKERFALGEGGVGEAAKQKEILVINNIPDGCVLSFGVGEIKPVQLVESPLIYNGNVVGVLELVATRKFTEEEIAWIEKASEIIAVSVFVILESQKIKTALVQVEEVKENIKMVLNSTVEGIYGVDTEGVITFCNNSALSLLGYNSEEELIGKHNHHTFHHSHPDGTPFEGSECPLLESLTEGKTIEREEMFWRADGTGFWVDVTSNPIIKNGEIKGAVVAFRDITEKKKVEEERKQERGLLEGFVKSLTGVIFYKDTKGNYLGCNQEFASIIGKTPEEIIGKNEYEIFPKEKADIFIASDRAVIEGEQPIRFEEWIDYADGKRAMIDTVKSILKSEDGKVIGVLGIGRDMTERKEMEEKINEERRRFEKILETAPVGVGISVNGVMQFVNPKITELLGAKVGFGIRDRYVHVEQRNKVVEEISKNGIIQNSEIEFYNNNNEKIDTLATYMEIEYSGQKGILGWIVDITERKKMELEITRERAKLQEILNVSPIGVGIAVGGVAKMANPKMMEMLGAKVGEAMQTRYVNPDDRTKILSSIKEKGILKDFEVKLYNKENEEREFIANYMSIDYQDEKGLLVWLYDITERKHAEREMEEAKQSLEIALTSAKMGTWKYNVLENQLKADDNTKRLYGLENVELDGTMGQWFTYLPPEDAKSVGEIMQYTMANAIEDYKADFRIIMPSGEAHYIMSVGKFTYNNEKQPVVASGVVWDITEIKEAEKRIAKINKLSDNALELTKAGFWEIDLLDQEWYTSSERAARIFGDPPVEGYRYKLFDHWAECVKAGDAQYAEKTFEIYQAAVEGKIPRYDAVYAYKRPIDGNIVWIHAIGEIERDESGKALKMYGVTQDITEEKLSEIKLLESQENIKKVLESAPVGLAIVDLVNAKPILVNNAICDLFDVSYEEGLNIDTRTIYANPDDRGVVFKEMQSNGKMKNKEFLYKKVHTDQPFWASCSMLPINYMGKNAVIASYLDVTEAKTMQFELETAKNTAEEATKSKSEFLANMSHEIRTPMNAIIGLNGLLERTELNKKQFDYVVKIGNAAKNLLGIINDILDFSKIEAGKIDLENIDFNLEEVLDNISNVIGTKAFEKGLEFVIAKESKVPLILKGDPLRLSQVLINLSNNAVKFTEKGEVIVKIKCTEVVENKAKLYFAVEDTGIGMTEDQLSKLFKAFSQADASTTRKYGGTGLGLMISKNIVEIMGGNIEVTSEYGKGSSFHFTVSIEIGNEKKGNSNIIPESIRGLKVLVADDNDAAREVLNEYLESFGMSPVLVASGEEAVSEVDNTFDLILMDWKMTGINGIEAWKRIKEKLGDKLPKIMIVTAYGKEEVVKKAGEEGIEEILMKPVAQSALFDTVLHLFGAEIKSKSTVGDSCDLVNLRHIRGAKLLLVEDNEINQQVARENLENEGFWVDIADNGQIAVEKVTKNEYELVLMDLQMPVLDGYKASKEIRKNDKMQELPIIALSADAMSGTRERVLEAGMNDYITKPIDKKELFETLLKWIKPGKREVFKPVEEIVHEEESIEGLYKKLKSFNVKDALVRLSGNYRLYVDILRKFEKNNGDFVKRIKEQIIAGDEETAERELHTIKGVSANIGGAKIQKLALILEQKLKNNEKILETSEFKELENEIEIAIDQIGTLNQNNTEKTGNILEKNDLIAKLEELKELIDNYDTKAESVLSFISSTLDAMKFSGQTVKLEKLIKAYDFEGAMEVCEEICEKIK